MTARAGNLRWRRARLALVDGVNLVDTLIKQDGQAFGADQPPLGIHTAVPPAPGDLPASRVQIIMLPPLGEWAGITDIGEPFLDPTSGTIKVNITTAGGALANVLFWTPHTAFSPGQADPYGPNDEPPPADCPPPEEGNSTFDVSIGEA